MIRAWHPRGEREWRLLELSRGQGGSMMLARCYRMLDDRWAWVTYLCAQGIADTFEAARQEAERNLTGCAEA